MDPTTYRRSAYLQQKRFSPSAVAIVIALHGAGFAALMLAKPELVYELIDQPPIVRMVPPDVDDPPLPEPPDETVPLPDPVPTNSPVELERPTVPRQIETSDIRPLPPTPPRSLPTPVPPAPPRLIEARFDPAHIGNLQPIYPPILIRREVEGSVTVRVRIDANGRVTAVENVRADDERFFEATRRHALRAWRFLPATRGGRPVESWQQHTVHFRIT